MKQIQFLFLALVTLYTVSDLFALAKVKEAAETAQTEVLKSFFKNTACSKNDNLSNEIKTALGDDINSLPQGACVTLYTSVLGDKSTIEEYLANNENWKQENFNASYAEFINVPEGKERKFLIKEDKSILYIYLQAKSS